MYSWKIIHGKHKRIALQSLIKTRYCISIVQYDTSLTGCFMAVKGSAMDSVLFITLMVISAWLLTGMVAVSDTEIEVNTYGLLSREAFQYLYRDNSSCGKIMFSQASVIFSIGGRVHPVGRHPQPGGYPP